MMQDQTYASLGLKPPTSRERALEFGYRLLMRARYLASWRRSSIPPSGALTDIYYLGHHKCASHWMRIFLLQLAPLIRASYVVHGGVPHRQFRSRLLPRTIHVHVNSDRNTFDSVPDEARGFHVVRDPRDALVSDYFSRRYAHEVHNSWHQEMRDYLNTHSMEEGLLFLMDQPSYLHQMAGWEIGSRPNILDVKYEALVADQFGVFKRITEHLGIEIPDAKLQKIVERCSFRKMSRGRAPGQENSRSQFRKGVAGDWRNHMPVGGRVHDEFNRRWADLVVRLGYEP